jgi:hypothetical protein
MILEVFLVGGLLGVILLFFYKQAVAEFRILQTESFQKAIPLLQERCPIVVSTTNQPPNLWTQTDIKQRPSLANSAINGTTLQEALKQESFPLVPKTAETLAKATGFPVWIQAQVHPIWKESAWWTRVLSLRTEVAIGSQGLRKTFAYSTILFCTEGALQVSLLNESSDPYLPTKWLGKRLSTLTRDEAPLLANIQYVDVIVRPGTALILPPHWKVCWESVETPTPALAVWTEVHHPVSKLVRSAFYK